MYERHPFKLVNYLKTQNIDGRKRMSLVRVGRNPKERTVLLRV